MRCWILVALLIGGMSAWAQSSSTPASDPASTPAGSSPASAAGKSKAQDSGPASSSSGQASSGQTGQAAQPAAPDLSPPRADSVNVSALGDDAGVSSSKDDAVDLSPPAGDAKAHPESGDASMDALSGSSGDVSEFHPWDPHKASKDVEVGDFYFKQKDYIGAESRYREALFYKDNDALATFRLAVCLEKMERPDEALQEYESYLRILPYGPESGKVKKAIDRLKGSAANPKRAK
jgi:tetratricopeptide (TPR) repeat protein